MSGRVNDQFRINLAEYYMVEENGLQKRIIPRARILSDTSALVIVSKLDQKVYYFTGFKISERKLGYTEQLAENLGKRFAFKVERIEFPSWDISPEHLQFIEYFVDEHYLPKGLPDTTKYYKCYFCEEKIDRRNKTCSSCGKDINYCFVCNFPILAGDVIGKCSLCGAVAHLVHFYEWLKTLGMCPVCNQKLHPEGIIPIIDENKENFQTGE
ncbi:MAG: hypothetical protein ACFFDW_15360 [Candidatus Thorarchaeota archaeon]